MSNTTEKKKILYVITKSEPFGGVQKYVYDLATNLSGRNWNVTVVFGGNGLLAEKLAAQPHIRTISLPRLARDIRISDEFVVFFSLLRILKQEKPDVVHVNSSKAGGLGALASRVYNAIQRGKRLFAKTHVSTSRIIFTAHGWPFNEDRSRLQCVLIYLFSWLTVLFTHITIAVSQKDAQQGKQFWFIGNKIAMVHNGLPERRFMAKEKARNALLGERAHDIPKDALWIGSIAELTKNKGISYAIKGIYRLLLDSPPEKPVVYIIIGGGEERYHIAHLIEELGMQKNIFLVGFKEDAAQYIKAFDLFLFPSIKEGLPYTLLEVGHAGIPTVATYVGGIPEIIEDMRTGILIRPREVNEIKNAVSFTLSHTKEMSTMKRALKEYVENEFSIEKMVSETEILYTKRGTL